MYKTKKSDYGMSILIDMSDLFDNIPWRLTLFSDMELDIGYNISPGRPASGPSYYSGGEPAEPASIEVVSIKFSNGEEIPDWLHDIIIDYVFDKYESDMFENAKSYHDY